MALAFSKARKNASNRNKFMLNNTKIRHQMAMRRHARRLLALKRRKITPFVRLLRKKAET